MQNRKLVESTFTETENINVVLPAPWDLHHFQDSGFLRSGLVCLGKLCSTENYPVGDKSPSCPSKMAAKSSDLLKLLAPTFLTLEYWWDLKCTNAKPFEEEFICKLKGSLHVRFRSATTFLAVIVARLWGWFDELQSQILAAKCDRIDDNYIRIWSHSKVQLSSNFCSRNKPHWPVSQTKALA